MPLIGPKSQAMVRDMAARTLDAIGLFSTQRVTPVTTALGTESELVNYLTGLRGRIGVNVGQEYAEALRIDNVKLWKVTLPADIDIQVTDQVTYTPFVGSPVLLTIKQVLTPQTGMDASTVLICATEGS